METILLGLFIVVGAIALLLFVNAVSGKKLLRGKEGLLFDAGKYLLISLLLLISIKYGSIIGIILFSLAGVGVYLLGKMGK